AYKNPGLSADDVHSWRFSQDSDCNARHFLPNGIFGSGDSVLREVLELFRLLCHNLAETSCGASNTGDFTFKLISSMGRTTDIAPTTRLRRPKMGAAVPEDPALRISATCAHPSCLT